MFRNNCLICDSSNLEGIVDLGLQPFADTFIPTVRLSEPDVIYPLACDLCTSCGEIQTKCVTNPKDRYVQHDYSYTSSNSTISRRHWDEFARSFALGSGAFVVEVGSNDGYLSQQFLNAGSRVLGVDPSPYMAELAKKRGVNTQEGLFGIKIGEEIQAEYGSADLVIANNVFNHSDNPSDFVKGVVRLLSPDGRFVFEQPYWPIGVRTEKFDQIYHEHVSYFTVRALSKLLGLADMEIANAEVVDYHGGSLRVVAQHKTHSSLNDSVNSLIKQEEGEGMFDLATYRRMMTNILDRRTRFLKQVYDVRAKGAPIVAVGAAAKGNTFLNFYNLNSRTIDFVTDSSPFKQGKFTPATRIPIVGDDVFARYEGEVYALILSWNIAEMIRGNLHKINPRINFLIPE